jgi:hypothetical protein
LKPAAALLNLVCPVRISLRSISRGCGLRLLSTVNASIAGHGRLFPGTRPAWNASQQLIDADIKKDSVEDAEKGLSNIRVGHCAKYATRNQTAWLITGGLKQIMRISRSNEPQIVDINEDIVPCIKCGANLVDVANFKYDGQIVTEATFVEEACCCKKCDRSFIMHYDLFDPKGHIYSKVFSEDINNPEVNWQDALTDAQKKTISEHLEHCEVCTDRLSQETLTDAWLKDFVVNLRKTRAKRL